MTDTYNIGRETFMLPVDWPGEWPSILTGTREGAVRCAPASGASTTAVMTTGNFVVRDEFDDTTLAPYWELMRTPHDSWYDLTSSAVH